MYNYYWKLIILTTRFQNFESPIKYLITRLYPTEESSMYAQLFLKTKLKLWKRCNLYDGESKTKTTKKDRFQFFRLKYISYPFGGCRKLPNLFGRGTNERTKDAMCNFFLPRYDHILKETHMQKRPRTYVTPRRSS